MQIWQNFCFSVPQWKIGAMRRFFEKKKQQQFLPTLLPLIFGPFNFRPGVAEN